MGNVGPGVLIWGGVSTEVGGSGDLGNTIAYSGSFEQYGATLPGDGVSVIGDTSIGNTVRGNSIFGNIGLGINFGYPLGHEYREYGVIPNSAYAGQPGPNNFQNFPVLTTVYAGASTTVIGTFSGTPNRRSFSTSMPIARDPSGYGQGQTWLGSYCVTTDANGNATLQATGLSAANPRRLDHRHGHRSGW